MIHNSEVQNESIRNSGFVVNELDLQSDLICEGIAPTLVVDMLVYHHFSKVIQYYHQISVLGGLI